MSFRDELKEKIKREINYRFPRDWYIAKWEQEQALDEAAEEILELTAAPEMYEFVKACFDSWDCDAGDGPDFHSPYCRKCGALSLLDKLTATPPAASPDPDASGSREGEGR